MSHQRKDRRGVAYDPNRLQPPVDDRRFCVRLDDERDVYYSKEHPWHHGVPKYKATWYTRVDAERIRHALAKPRIGFRRATIEEK